MPRSIEHIPSPKVKVERFKHEIKVNQVQVADPIIEEPILEPEQTDRDGGKAVSGAVRVSEPQDLYSYIKDWCFASVYKKGQADSNNRR